jgi:hypothetical protein
MRAPAGMFVPPNWIGLGIFGLLGLLNPGFWIIGFGCELAYLGWLSNDARFQRVVHGAECWMSSGGGSPEYSI